MPKQITKPTTVKTFLKANTTQRVGEDAITSMFDNLNKFSVDIVKKAETFSLAENRTTILNRDIDQAFKGSGGEIENNPDSIFKAIETMDAETIGKVIKKILNPVPAPKRKPKKNA